MCLALASPALIGVGRIGGFSFLSFPEMSVTVEILPYEFLEGFLPSYTCSAISICSNMAQFSLKVFISKSHPCRVVLAPNENNIFVFMC